MEAHVAVRGSAIAGLGVFAVSGFARGAVVLGIDDTHVVDAEHPVPPGQEVHCDFLAGGRVVWMQTPERYINHSCDPNVYTRTRDGVREVVARRAIAAGEELLFDYSINGSGETVWACRCGAARCRRMVHSDFFHLPLPLQREYLPLLEAWFVEERTTEMQTLRNRTDGC